MLNPRHETFAVALARGLPQADAYVAAGYRRNEAGASRLAKKGQVASRVRELQAEVTERALAPLVISKQRILQELATIAFAPLGDSLVSTGEKRKALVDLARVAGFMVERREVGSVGQFDHLSDDELRDIIHGQSSALGRRRAGLSSQ